MSVDLDGGVAFIANHHRIVDLRRFQRRISNALHLNILVIAIVSYQNTDGLGRTHAEINRLLIAFIDDEFRHLTGVGSFVHGSTALRLALD